MTTDTPSTQLLAYQDAIRRQVCGACLDSRDDGTCGLPEQACPLDARLPLVLDALASVHSVDIGEYARAVEERICSDCPRRPDEGECPLRTTADCALIAYLPLLVDAVERDRG